MNEFIEANTEARFFGGVFVDSVSEDFDTESTRPVTQPSATDSPLKGKSVSEWLSLLKVCFAMYPVERRRTFNECDLGRPALCINHCLSKEPQWLIRVANVFTSLGIGT